jgi:peptidoglycan/xylan/chitin deacetylase (PgdA/CDA1 family)
MSLRRSDSPNQQLTVCLSFDFDGTASWLMEPGGRHDLTTLSRGEYGAAMMPRVLEFLREQRLPATFFVPGTTALEYPNLVEAVVADGHELGHHGWAHERPGADDERDTLERGLEALEQVAGIRPSGYRSPSWALTDATLRLLAEFGFSYDSSCMGNDFFPYYLRIGDHFAPGKPAEFGSPCEVVEAPVTWGLDDSVLFEFVPGQLQGLAAPSAVEEIWRGDFDYGVTHAPEGVLVLTLHPHVIARGHRMLLLERLVNHMRQRAEFATIDSYVASWRRDNTLEDWVANQLALTGRETTPRSN